MNFSIALLLAATSLAAQTTTLTTYLNLTSQQAAAVTQSYAAYSAYLTAQNSQAASLNTQLANLYGNPIPDAFSIGTRYVSLESIRRDIAAHLADLHTQAALQLTPAQVALLPGLSAALILQTLASDAQCAFLVASVRNPLTDLLLGVPGISLIDPTTTTPPNFAPVPTGAFCGSDQFPLDVREYFNITDAQVSAFFSASARYRDYYSRQQNRIADLQVQIRDETAKPSPDPNVLGLYYLQLASIGQDIQKQADMLSKSASAVLSADQTAKLNALQSTVSLQYAASQAIQCGFLTNPPGVQTTLYAYLGPACQP